VIDTRRSLALLNVVGGIAVLGSYVLAFAYAPAVREGLWGGVPAWMRPLYTANMLCAAAGYFPFTARFVLGPPPEALAASFRAPYRALHVAYALVLGPSALWLPLTAAMIAAPSTLLWIAIRIDLALVALGASSLLVLAARDALATRARGAWLALLGVIPFALQTVVLDALVWPAFYP
jgi:hypothetical protein